MNATPRLTENLPSTLVRWLEGRDDLAQAWRTCPSASWLIHLALAVELDRALIVQAAVDVVSSAITSAAPADMHALRALRVARAWLDGRAQPTEAWAAAFAASEAAEVEPDPKRAAVIRAASLVAFACDDRAEPAYYAHRADAARAVELADGALADDTAGTPPAAWIRARIPLPTVLSALAKASEPPPPMPDDSDPADRAFYA
jgi:hypothetical protein